MNNTKVNTNLIDSSTYQTRLLNLTILNSAITPKVKETERTISSIITSSVTLTITSTTKLPDNSIIKQTTTPPVSSTISPTTTPPEPNAYFYPKGQDNTKPLDDTNLLKELPIHGCTNKTNLLVGVRTSPKEFTEREWIRNNWGRYRSPEVPLIFLIGNTNNETIRNGIIEEKKKYGDILLLNFDDHYRNLSVKTYGLFKYFVEYCPNANCLVKPDSDTITNINGIERFCNLAPTDKIMITCRILHNFPVSKNHGKWYVPHYVYPKKKYENFAAGWGFLLTGKNSAQDFIDTLKNKTPFLTSENYRRLPDDAILTGEVRVLANISIQDVGGFSNGGVLLWKDPITNLSIPLMTSNRDEKVELWQRFQDIIEENKRKEAIAKNMTK